MNDQLVDLHERIRELEQAIAKAEKEIAYWKKVVQLLNRRFKP